MPLKYQAFTSWWIRLVGYLLETPPVYEEMKAYHDRMVHLKFDEVNLIREPSK